MFLHNHTFGEQLPEGVQEHNRPAGSSARAAEGFWLSPLLDQRICQPSEGAGPESWASFKRETWVTGGNQLQVALA